MIEQTVKHLPPNDMDVRPFTLKEKGNLINRQLNRGPQRKQSSQCKP